MRLGCGLESLQHGAKITQSKRHAGVPGSAAFHLRSVVRNDDAVEVVLPQDFKNAQRIDVTGIDERLAIARRLAVDVAQVDISQFPLAAVMVHNLVDISSVISASVPTPNLQSVARLGFKSISFWYSRGW